MDIGVRSSRRVFFLIDDVHVIHWCSEYTDWLSRLIEAPRLFSLFANQKTTGAGELLMMDGGQGTCRSRTRMDWGRQLVAFAAVRQPRGSDFRVRAPHLAKKKPPRCPIGSWRTRRCAVPAGGLRLHHRRRMEALGFGSSERHKKISRLTRLDVA